MKKSRSGRVRLRGDPTVRLKADTAEILSYALRACPLRPLASELGGHRCGTGRRPSGQPPDANAAAVLLSTRFHNYGDVFRDGDRCPISERRRHTWPQRHKDTEKNSLHLARSTRRRAAAGEACQPQTNDHWTVARSFVCGLRASRLGLRCRPPASSASVSQCLLCRAAVKLPL